MIQNPANLLKYISYGVYVIAVSDGSQQNAFTAAWVMQVSFEPLLLAFSINPKNFSYKLLQKGSICSINVLGHNQYALAEHFGRAGIQDKMRPFKWQIGQSGVPVLSSSLAYFDCRVSHFTDAGDHKIVICNIIDAGILNPGRPLLYSQTGDMDGSSDLYGDNQEEN
jgi:flavin reductase (DIM6/NTAB) family NADH-FMN oxidoreductase RutF